MDKLAQLKEYMEAGKYEAAVALLPEIKENKAKTAPEMMLLAGAYGKCADFEHAERLFKKAYKIRPSKLLFRDMIDICIECGRTDEAESYYEHYKEVASSDAFNLGVFKYRIEKKKGSDKAVLINCLKEILLIEYTPEWAYELAKIYHKSGMKDECVAELERIVSTFDEDTGVVIKAKTLIAYYRGEITAEEIVAKGKQRDIPRETPSAKPPATPAAAKTPDPEPVKTKTEHEETGEPPKKHKRKGLFGFGRDDSDEDEESWGASEHIESSKSKKEPKGSEETSEPAGSGETTEPAEPTEPEYTTEPVEVIGSAESTGSSEAAVTTAEAETQENTEPAEAEDTEKEEIRKTAEAELSLELEAEEEDSRTLLPRLPKEELFTPHVILSQEDLRDSKAKRIIISKEIRPEDICKNFFRIGEVRRQIFKSMDLVINERKRIFLCITGEPGTGRSTFAARMVRLYHRMGLLKNDVLAGTEASVLNRLPSGMVTKMLSDYSILIENAGELSEDCIAELIQAADEKKSGTCVVLEDTSRNINSLLRGGNDLRALVNNRIHLPKYDTVDLIGFAYDVAMEGQYMLSVKAAKKLKDGIDSRRIPEPEKFMTVVQAMKAAVDRADERYAPVILKMAAEAAFDDEGRLVITESDVTL
ncbi:MAG: hypothetical protein J6Z46_11135 [Lachnospiraceae bacterium]|nr:hypothetical protein [Lachnospiraceae bacterium]